MYDGDPVTRSARRDVWRGMLVLDPAQKASGISSGCHHVTGHCSYRSGQRSCARPRRDRQNHERTTDRQLRDRASRRGSVADPDGRRRRHDPDRAASRRDPPCRALGTSDDRDRPARRHPDEPPGTRRPTRRSSSRDLHRGGLPRLGRHVGRHRSGSSTSSSTAGRRPTPPRSCSRLEESSGHRTSSPSLCSIGCSTAVVRPPGPRAGPHTLIWPFPSSSTPSWPVLVGSPSSSTTSTSA